MLIGYARVSSDEQDTAMQLDALSEAGCKTVYEEKASGASSERLQLKAALKALRAGDTLVVWRLDRLGRSLPHLIETIANLEEMGVGFRSLTEALDTTTAGGKLVFHVFAALADFERSLIKERTKAGLKAARARGRVGGRPRKLSDKQVSMAEKLLETHAAADVADQLGVDRSTLYRALKAREETQAEA
jgi:DNA invertase Pin-like site-specific DNA recombinase